MSLPTLPTLAYVRSEILQRMAISTRGNSGARAYPMADSCIRQAMRELELEAPWTRLQVTREVTLLADTGEYDFPDDMDSGSIEFIGVRNITTEKILELCPDPDQMERNALVNTSLTRPIFWWTENDVINILPKPDVDEWDALVLRGFVSAEIPTDDTDQVPFDGEAIIQLAEKLARARMGMDWSPSLEKSREKYLSNLRSRQGDGEGTMPGGATSAKVAPDRGDRRRGRGEWETNWNPPGYWGP